MAVVSFRKAIQFWRRYNVVIIFPTLAATSILADVVHTRRWKEAQSREIKEGKYFNDCSSLFAGILRIKDRVKCIRLIRLMKTVENLQLRMNISKIFGNSPKHYVAAVLPAVGLYIGWYFDRKETERMIRFRDKSALYGRELKPGEKPSWP